MTFRTFELVFNQILCHEPLPYGHHWKFERLTNAGFQLKPKSKSDWFEILYRTRADYQCNHRHFWQSSWSMILFRFHLDSRTGRGIVRMKRFGLRCRECDDTDDTYHIGICNDYKQVWYTVQRLLLYILQRCYEGRRDCDVDMDEYIIPVTDVPQGRFGGGPHRKDLCEACAHDRCQEIYQTLTKRK